MTVIRCRWCDAVATGTVTASGIDPIDYCNQVECWEQCYKIVRSRVPRTWGPVKARGRRPQQRQAGPDLFSLLPEQGGEVPHER